MDAVSATKFSTAGVSRRGTHGDDLMDLIQETEVKGKPTGESKQSTNDAVSKWRSEVQRNIEAKKQKEAEALQTVTKKAEEELNEWRRTRKEKIEAKAVKTEGNAESTANVANETAFDWKKVAAMLTKSGYAANDQNSGQSQKMIDLIFMKAKE